MNLNTTVNVILLCIINTLFTFSGIFLNSMVIVSFWTSSQLRKKTCYFMVLVLACYDLAMSSIGHPLLMIRTLMWYREESYTLFYRELVPYIRIILYSNSFIALLGMNVERYLALTFPFFHERSVTKIRILTAVLLTQLLFVLLIIWGFVQQNETYTSILILVSLALLLVLMILMNYKLLKIAKTIQRNNVFPACMFTNRVLKNKIKNTSTCVLAVGCLLLFSLPTFIFTGLSVTSLFQRFSEDAYTSFNLWECSLVTTNATFNCLIFYWRNNTLRSEGRKVVKGCLRVLLRPFTYF